MYTYFHCLLLERNEAKEVSEKGVGKELLQLEFLFFLGENKISNRKTLEINNFCMIKKNKSTHIIWK